MRLLLPLSVIDNDCSVVFVEPNVSCDPLAMVIASCEVLGPKPEIWAIVLLKLTDDETGEK